VTASVRLRGIYTTALTELLLAEGYDVVQASPPIRRRFDADIAGGDHDVAVETTDDRQGVGVEGEQAAVESVTSQLRAVGIDTFAWDDPTPRAGVFDGRVTDTRGGGAVVDLGVGEGYLPFRNVERRIESGDRVRAQVIEPASPWSDDRPLLDTEISAFAGVATLVPGQSGTTVDTYDDAEGRGLAEMTDLLDADVPEGWGVRWSHSATEADMATLSEALSRASERARQLSSAGVDGTADATDPEAVGEPGPVVVPSAGRWVWFGRESRFALDDLRREVTTTMPGHHRTKAASESASAGVDFAEALCEPTGEFPFGVVTDQFGPTEGDSVTIGHGKPDGRLIVLGTGEVTDRDSEGSLSIRREMSPGGDYDALGVPRESGDVALTTFREGRWWYPTVYRDSEGERKGTYVNVCTPVECFPDTVRYVDLHVDVVKHRDGTVERVDDDELDQSVADGEISEQLAEKARSVASAVENAL
jgi:Ribonuclease G/E